ncbi:MAG: hypothetical protein ACOC4K_01505, partial [Verrucomicrobiota bacterium]
TAFAGRQAAISATVGRVIFFIIGFGMLKFCVWNPIRRRVISTRTPGKRHWQAFAMKLREL